MKKIILSFALLAVMLCITGCDENFDEPGSGYDESFGEPVVTLTINDSKKDTKNENLVFGKHSEREDFVYAHYYIEGSSPEYDIRIRVETRTGENDHEINEEYTTLFDETKTKKSGKWHSEEIYVISAIRYFYRVTIYNGATEEILATKTFYTPNKETAHTVIPQSKAEYRPSKMTEEEQIFYDLCSYSVFDHAKKHEYSEIGEIEGYFSADGTKLYLEVVFRAPWSEYFEINVNDPTDYSVSYEPFDVEGLEKALSDYYYVKKEFAKNL
ncbi:MAG: hypothetical protein IJ945_00330 [Oscillospiraceae bacterium]|nr:hypothetical protein [Oscillospiraceae bacterium]